MLPEKSKYKLFLILTKYMPIILSILYSVYSLFSILGYNVDWLHYTCSVSLIPIIYFYSSSITLQFCFCHRMFIHYITVCDFVTIAQEHLYKFLGILINVNIIHTFRILLLCVLIGILVWYKYKTGLTFCIKQNNK